MAKSTSAGGENFMNEKEEILLELHFGMKRKNHRGINMKKIKRYR